MGIAPIITRTICLFTTFCEPMILKNKVLPNLHRHTKKRGSVFGNELFLCPKTGKILLLFKCLVKITAKIWRSLYKRQTVAPNPSLTFILKNQNISLSYQRATFTTKNHGLQHYCFLGQARVSQMCVF